MKNKIDSFYLEYMVWIKTKTHLTLLSLCAADFSFAQLAKGKKSRP